MQVNALSNLLGPIIGGFLYGFLHIDTILFISGVCFFLSAVMELFCVSRLNAGKKRENPAYCPGGFIRRAALPDA